MELSTIAVLLVILRLCSSESTLNEGLDELNSRYKFGEKVEEFLERKNNGVSLKCNSQMNTYIRALSNNIPWALKMFDATAKYPSGIWDGNSADLGFFDECLEIETKKIRRISGQYCLAKLYPIKVENNTQYLSNHFYSDVFQTTTTVLRSPHQFGICIPNACSATELEKLFTGMGYNFTFNDELCQTKSDQPELDTGAIVTLSFLGVIVWILLACTTYDILTHYLGKKPMYPILTSFSVLTNGRKLITTSNNSSQISCLHGIRVISTMWVILGHRYSYHASLPIRNSFYLSQWMNDRASLFILNAPLAVDTFFLMSGLVLAYMYMSTVSKGIKFNIILFYIHRIVRLTPVLAVVILINATLVKYFGSGPMYPTTTNLHLIEGCEQYWWKSLLYIQNYGNSAVCLPHGWYLSVDTQLFVLSPILLIPLKKWPLPTLFATGILTLCTMIASFLTGWFMQLRTNILGNITSQTFPDYMKWYYFATHTRATPWLIGIALGYYIFQAKQRRVRLILNKWLVFVVWVAALIVLCTCLFTGHDLIFGEYNRLANSIHMALVRPAWAIALSWIIYTCVIGYGGPVNYFLSLPIFQVISKFTYTLYLVHLTIVVIISAQMRVPSVFSNARAMYAFWGDFAFSFVIAVLFTLAFESPLITIERTILGSTKKPEIKPSETEGVRQIPKPLENA